ncbi:hypothetical protein SPLC1_S240350 [Arthrospira platensis C1]|uniref:Uncharacterized protein n=1 Tax=Limnospira indica PCC 8005 TaxID=376219 RepID=A0A9P1KJU0_9CYAN|nr:hypothetical protein SPLC1_S240350 [Arthrospira platensis C1]MDT9230372.1 hypothetical protein [Limnospira sp. PMC 1242.20]CDM97351.1 conserved protein of unknown function [Limnospira indica PCC 8005]
MRESVDADLDRGKNTAVNYSSVKGDDLPQIVHKNLVNLVWIVPSIMALDN